MENDRKFSVRGRFIYSLKPIVMGVLIFLLLTSNSSLNGDKPAFQYFTYDAVLLDVYGLFDQNDVLEGYTARVITPVCEDDKCYEAALDFHWDVLGHFIDFQLLPERPLTKSDHIPFVSADYEKLRNVLLDNNPPFIHLKRTELVIEHAPGEEVQADGRTGATIKALKEELVDGAIYTCYTLWHIANGDIIFQMQERTKDLLNESLVRKLLNSNQTEAHYFLIENLDATYFRLFLPELMELTCGYDQFYIGRMIDRIPSALLEQSEAQAFFIEHYQLLEPMAQKNLMSKLDSGISLTEATLDFLVDQIRLNNSSDNNQLVIMVCAQMDRDKIDILQKMFDVIIDRKIVLSQSSYEVLVSTSQPYKSLKQSVKKLKHTHK